MRKKGRKQGCTPKRCGFLKGTKDWLDVLPFSMVFTFLQHVFFFSKDGRGD